MKCPRCGRPAKLVIGIDWAVGEPRPLDVGQVVSCSCVPPDTLVVVRNGWRARVGRRLADALAELSKAVGQ